tara:strand:- start:283 stop:675 length:393 start_codon:yes stop_codon:yes gene_type:complete
MHFATHTKSGKPVIVIKTMKLPTDYENLLKHVVDGFNRNFFRNEFKANLKIIADSQKVMEEIFASSLDTVDASGEEKSREMREHYLNRIKTAQASLEAIGKGLMEHLANQLDEAKELLITIQSKTTTEEN